MLRDGIKSKQSPVGKARWRTPKSFSKVELRDAVARESNRSRMMEDGAEIVDMDANGDEDAFEAHSPRTLKPQEPQKAEQPQDKDREERRLIRRDQKQIEVYYRDPLQLADGVLQRLRVPDIEGALRLVRASQTFDIKNIVSWNHCCDWLMSQGQVRQALSVYNEMKKRGQRPDAHTYTIMLRGLSQHIDKPNAVTEAVKIYNSIFAPNSAVKPNTIHTNAIINVCARGGDMDSLWAVAGRLPERGAGSPDRITFSTILNAIRENTIKEAAKSADRATTSKGRRDGAEEEAAVEERRILYAKAVEDGRKLWEDISYRWRRADLVIDEQLVCAMGRLLLTCGEGKDMEQVLDLVEVTMNLRLRERGKQNKNQVPWLEAPADDASKPTYAGRTDQDKTEASKLPLKESSVYATPGQNTLSMLLQACGQRRAIQHLSSHYWRLLTDPEGPYQIKPDAGNILAYLRLLRLQRASEDSYKLLAQNWPADVAKVLYRRASFVIAFSTCARDKRNPNVFKTAQKLLKLAGEKAEERAVNMYDETVVLSEMGYHKRKRELQNMKKELKGMTPEEAEEMERNKEGVQSLNLDPKILNYFLELAIATTDGWNEGLRGKDDGTMFERHPSKNHTMIALQMMASQTKELKRLVKVKMEEIQNADVPRRRKQRALDPRAGSRVGENFDDLIQLMRSMIGAWDRCLDVHERFKTAGREGLDPKIMGGFYDRKREMTAYMAKMERAMGEKLRQRREFQDARQRPNEEDLEDFKDEDDAQTDLETRINSVLEGVDAELVEARMAEKNRKSQDIRHYGDAKNMHLNLGSRRQKRERGNLIESRMNRAFPKEDFGTLNSDLQIVSGKDAKVSQREDQKRLLDQGFIRGLSSGSPARARDRTGFQEEGVDKETRSAQQGTDPVAWNGFDARPRPRSSILDRAEVKSAWQRPAAATSGTS